MKPNLRAFWSAVKCDKHCCLWNEMLRTSFLVSKLQKQTEFIRKKWLCMQYDRIGLADVD